MDVLAREVARRAGVSHRAPYNHFPEKLDLLAAVAAVGFDRLHDGLARATAGIDDPEALLDVICRTYVRLGLENPALYRLMFGPVLSDTGAGDRPISRPGGRRPGESCAGKCHPARRARRLFCRLARQPARRVFSPRSRLGQRFTASPCW